MPIHYEQDDEHVVLITIDRPEARNSADMEHFKRCGRRGTASTPTTRPGSRSSPVSARRSSPAPTSRRTSPRSRSSRSASPKRGSTEIDGYRLDDGTKAVLRNAKLCKPIIAAVNGFCTAGGMEMLGGVDIRVACPEAKFAVMEPKRGLFAGGGTTVRLPAADPVAAGDGVPAVRRPHPRRAGVRDGAAERGRPARAAPRHGARVRAAHDRQRAARGAGDEAERAPGPVPRRGARASACARRCARSDQILATLDTSDPASAKDAVAAAADVLEGLGQELRTAFEEESKLSSCDLPDRGRQGRPEGVRREAAAELAGEVVAVDPRDAVHHRCRAADVASRGRGRRRRARAARDVGAASRARPRATAAAGRRARGARQPRHRLLPDLAVRRPAGAGSASASVRAPARAHYSGIGGTTPQVLVDRTPGRASCAGEIDLALVTGAEALATQRPYKKRGERCAVLVQAGREAAVPVGGAVPTRRRSRTRSLQAWLTFAVFDNARRAHLGIRLDEYRARARRAARADDRGRGGEPDAWFRIAALASTRSSRRDPTTAWSATRTRSTWSRSWTSTWRRALLLASHERADALGVPPEQRVYLRGWCYATDPIYVAEHAEMWRSPAMAGGERRGAPGRRASAIDDVAHLDLYSCFGELA